MTADKKAYLSLQLGHFFDTAHDAELLTRLIINKSGVVFPSDDYAYFIEDPVTKKCCFTLGNAYGYSEPEEQFEELTGIKDAYFIEIAPKAHIQNPDFYLFEVHLSK